MRRSLLFVLFLMTNHCGAFKSCMHRPHGCIQVAPCLSLQPPPIQAAVARPLFLEQDERRTQGSAGMGEQTSMVFPYMPQQHAHETMERRRMFQEVMEENRKLRERVEVLEKGEEEPKFSTPNGESKEVDKPQVEVPKSLKDFQRLRPPLRRLLDPPKEIVLKVPASHRRRPPLRRLLDPQ